MYTVYAFQIYFTNFQKTFSMNLHWNIDWACLFKIHNLINETFSSLYNFEIIISHGRIILISFLFLSKTNIMLSAFTERKPWMTSGKIINSVCIFSVYIKFHSLSSSCKNFKENNRCKSRCNGYLTGNCNFEPFLKAI